MTSPSGNGACNGSMEARTQPVAIRIASFLCYAWGIILLVLTVTALLPLRAKPRALTAALAFLSIVILVGAAYCLAGYLLRRRATSGAWFTGILVALTTALQLVMHLNFDGVNMKPPWLVVNGVLIILFVANRMRAGAGRRGVDA